MSKTAINGKPTKRDANGNKISSKSTSHGSNRCKRHPNSKRCKQAVQAWTNANVITYNVTGRSVKMLIEYIKQRAK